MVYPVNLRLESIMSVSDIKSLLPLQVAFDENPRLSPEIHAQQGWEVSLVETGEHDLNVEMSRFIALACNSHYKLVEALRVMVSAGLTQFDRGTHKIGLDNIDLLAKARAALAAAE